MKLFANLKKHQWIIAGAIMFGILGSVFIAGFFIWGEIKSFNINKEIVDTPSDKSLKIYTNEEYGVELQYPKDVIIEEREGYIFVWSKESMQKAEDYQTWIPPEFIINKVSNEQIAITSEWLAKKDNGLVLQNFTEPIGGKNAFVALPTELGTKTYIIPTPNGTFMISAWGHENGKYYNEVINTLKFLEDKEKISVLIYAQEITQTSGNSRVWPTVQIMRKVGNNDSEFLAEVGKVGEYPANYKLSPDNKFLLINLGSKLQILNLSTKKLDDLFLPKQQVASVSYSPDAKKLFIWDQKYGQQNGEYYAHIFDIITREDQILKQGNIDGSFFSVAWRDDGNVTMYKAMGEFARPYYFNLATNELRETPNTYAAGVVSTSGKLMSTIKEHITDVCNDMSASAPGLYNVIDPVSGNVLAIVDKPGYSVEILAFSQDDKEILYRTHKPWEDRENCEKNVEYEYFIAVIDTGESSMVNDLAVAMSSWSSDYIGAVANYNYKENTWSIMINDHVLVTADKNLSVAGQFYYK